MSPAPGVLVKHVWVQKGYPRFSFDRPPPHFSSLARFSLPDRPPSPTLVGSAPPPAPPLRNAGSNVAGGRGSGAEAGGRTWVFGHCDLFRNVDLRRCPYTFPETGFSPWVVS